MDLRRRKPTQQKAMAASVASGIRGFLSGPKLAVLADVAMVSVVVGVAAEGVTVAGEKLQVAPVGCPEQANDTAEENPFSGMMKTVVVPL